jgi:hypothetical protein
MRLLTNSKYTLNVNQEAERFIAIPAKTKAVAFEQVFYEQ